MIFNRQKRLLALLYALGGTIGSIDFQKLLFLYCTEVEETPSYEFVPYRFGCFSFTSYADKRKLINARLLIDNDKHWQLSGLGRDKAVEFSDVSFQVNTFSRRYAALRGDALVAETYKRYPYYATRSEMVDELDLLPDDRNRINAARPAKQLCGLLTIGYEERSLEAYLNLLLKANVTVLCDVRKNPLSRKYGFSKKALQTACEGLEIRYVHAPELGIASAARKNLKTPSDYTALFKAYKNEVLPQNTEALEKIFRWVGMGNRVALTCFERKPEMCHRHCVVEAVRDIGEQGVLVRHL